MTRQTIKYVLLCLLAFSIMGFSFSSHAAHEKEKLLIIHSYHQGLLWTDELHRGITASLPIESYDIYTEYLEAYRTPEISNQQVLDKLVSYYSSQNLKAIIITDNTAYNLMQSIHDDYFNQVPVFFVGVNELPENILHSEYKGILQNSDFNQLMNWISRDFSRIHNILLLGSDNSTSYGTLDQLTASINALSMDYEIIPILGNDLAKQVSEIQKYDTDDTMLYVAGSITNYVHEEYASHLEESTDMLTFVGVSPAISGNVMGGYVVDPYEHGQLLGDMVKQYLDGEFFTNLTTVIAPVQSLILNYNALSKYDVRNSAIPRDAIILNEPSTAVSLDQTDMILIISIITVLFLITGALLYILHIKSKANAALLLTKQALLESNMELEAHTEELIASREELDEQFYRVKESNERIEYLLNHDQLTDYYQSPFILATIEKLKKKGQPFAVIYGIFDGMESIAFSFGNRVYEEILKQITHGLKHHLGDEDMFYGLLRRDQVVLVTTKPENIEQGLAYTHEQKFNSLYGDNYILHINTRFGIALGDEALSPESMINHASIAAISLKEGGAQYMAYYNERLMHKFKENNMLQVEISKALQQKEFKLYLQPKYDVRSGKICGFEALIRWPQPDGSMRYPDQFIPLAEQTGQIIPLGNYVIDEACRLIYHYKLADHGLHIAINLSAQHFYDNQIITILKDTIKKYEIPASSLELELTETSIVKNIDNAQILLTEMRKMGHSIAVDDMGTGYSSLSHLRNFPVDKVKIDRIFVQALPESKNMVITESLINLCRRLGYQVVVEGVETKEHVDILRPLMPDEFQGYYFAKPMHHAEAIFQAIPNILEGGSNHASDRDWDSEG